MYNNNLTANPQNSQKNPSQTSLQSFKNRTQKPSKDNPFPQPPKTQKAPSLSSSRQKRKKEAFPFCHFNNNSNSNLKLPLL